MPAGFGSRPTFSCSYPSLYETGADVRDSKKAASGVGVHETVHLLDQSGHAVGLRDHCFDANFGSFGTVDHVLVQRKYDQVRLRNELVEPASGIESVHSRHGQVEDDEIGL